MDMRNELTVEECEIVKKDILEIIKSVFENSTPYIHIYTEEPYQNQYTGRIGYDTSGEVVKATEKDIMGIVNNLGNSEYARCCCESDFDEFANSINHNRWNPTYMSGCGKHWVSFSDDIKEDMRNYMYENYEIYDSEEDESNDDLECFIEDLMIEVYNSCSVNDYLPLVLSKVDTVKDEDIVLFSKIQYGVEDGEKYLKIIADFKNKVTSLTGKKTLSLASSGGLLTIEIDEYGLIEDRANATEGFYAYIISLMIKESFGMTIRQLIGDDGKNQIYKIYGVRFNNNGIEYISSSEMKVLHCLNSETGKCEKPEKNVYYSQLN